jgi:hypothetical protein
MASRTRMFVVAAAVVVLASGGGIVAAAARRDHSPRAATAAVATTTTTVHVHTPDMAMDGDAVHNHARDFDALLAAATPEQRAAAAELVAATRAATAKYADYDDAHAAGYGLRVKPLVSKPTHFPNPALMRDGHVLDPEAPETLMYWTAPDGRRVLVGAVYKTSRLETAPTPGGALTAWHTHTSVDHKCYPALDASCPQDSGKMMHVFFFDGVNDPFTENMVLATGGRAEFARAMRTWAA